MPVTGEKEVAAQSESCKSPAMSADGQVSCDTRRPNFRKEWLLGFLLFLSAIASGLAITLPPAPPGQVEKG